MRPEPVVGLAAIESSSNPDVFSVISRSACMLRVMCINWDITGVPAPAGPPDINETTEKVQATWPNFSTPV